MTGLAADLLRGHAVRHQIPGAAIGLLRDGETTTACYGVANATTGEPVTSETRFGVGSLTKSMVATVIARLADAGRLSLDDPAVAHVPELGSARWAMRATLRDLLANRSGLPLRIALEFDFAGTTEDDEQVLARFASRVAEAEPTAAVWSYTNAGWSLLGRAIETVTGLPWEQAMHEHLFGPVGMTETTFAGPRAAGHQIADGEAVPVAPLGAKALGPAGTTAISTVTDMLRFAAVHLEDPSLARLRDSGAELRLHGWFDAWCHGWARFDWDGGPVWGWDSVLPGERAFLRFVPERKAAVVLMTNAEHGRSLYRSLFQEFLDEALAVRMPPLHLEPSSGVAGDLARFAGVYAWPDRRAEVHATNDHLVIEADGDVLEARAIDDRTLLVDAGDPDNPSVTFDAFDGDGRPHALYLMLWALPRVT